MDIKTILNRCHPIRGFVYGKSWFEEDQVIGVDVRPRCGARGICSGCGKRGRTYDTGRTPRGFAFIPLWGFTVFLWYCMRRVDCARCGATTEMVPWADGKHRSCYVYRQFLAFWAKRLSWTEVGRVFHTSWGVVFRSVNWVVDWGLTHRDLKGVTAIGIDEIAVWAGHKYLTVVYQIDQGIHRLLWVGRDRTEKSLNAFFTMFGKARSARLRFVKWTPSLDHLMKGRRARTSPVVVSPGGVVARRSTDLLATDDQIVLAALRMIRDNVNKSLRVADVVRAVRVSRRNLELRFSRALGVSPHDEIQRTRLRRIKDLLLRSDWPLKQISMAAGFTRPEHMHAVFRRDTGLTPARYRALHT